MSNLTGPDFITIHVRDLDVSRKFYSKVLGLKISPEVRPNAFAFATKPIGFAIRKSQVDLDAVSLLGHGIILWFNADDAVSLYRKLLNQDVLIEQGVTESPFGKTFSFRDPDGYIITVHDGG